MVRFNSTAETLASSVAGDQASPLPMWSNNNGPTAVCIVLFHVYSEKYHLLHLLLGPTTTLRCKRQRERERDHPLSPLSLSLSLFLWLIYTLTHSSFHIIYILTEKPKGEHQPPPTMQPSVVPPPPPPPPPPPLWISLNNNNVYMYKKYVYNWLPVDQWDHQKSRERHSRGGPAVQPYRSDFLFSVFHLLLLLLLVVVVIVVAIVVSPREPK